MSDKTVDFYSIIRGFGYTTARQSLEIADAVERAVLTASEDRRDAERYRWIRSEARNQWDGETAIDVIEAGGRRMDAVIDAAIAAAGNHKVEGE